MTYSEHHSSEFNAVLKDIPNIRFLDVIKDAHIRSAFATFNQTQVSNETFLVVAILITLSSVVFMFRFRAFLTAGEYDREELIAATVLSVTIIVLVIIMWILWYLKRKRVDPKRKKVLKSLYKIQPVLQVILPIGISFFYGLQLIVRVRGGQCESDKLYLNMLMCNPNQNTNGLPEETLAQLMLMPIVFHIILRDSLVGTFFISYLMSLGSVIFAAFMLDVRQVMPFLLVYFFFSSVIHYDNQRQNLSLFYLAEKLKFTLSENERLADETHASELRHMIANVAHDLKTPLTSFLSGVEFIAQVVTDWDERLSDPAKSLNTTENIEFTSESLTAIHGCLESIRNTNSFMIMTINRCIDFTKASKGLKLIPKLETIDLQETVDLPIKVMRDFKSHLAINLLPIAPDICTHVISDRQWLQENLLCLMSNAVKYSSKGTVEICVTLVKLPFVKPTVEKPVTSIKPTSRPKKTSLNKGRVAPEENSGRSRLGSIGGGSSNGGGSTPGSPKNTILVTSNSGKNTFLGANLFSATNNSFRDGSNPSSVNEATLDSLKVRKLSNFVFNHDYSTMGRSRIFSDKELDGEEGYEGSGKSQKVNSGTAMIEEENEGDEDEEGLFLKIEVQDTGIGLSEEAMRSLFTPFKQAQRLAGGTGLGLYSLAKRIEALCGHYGVSNRKDNKQGSLFWFAIPYRPDTVFAQSMLKQNKMRSNSMRGVNHAAHAARAAAVNSTINSPSNGNDLIDLEAAPALGALMGLGSNSRSNNSLLASEASGGASSGRPSSAISTSSKINDHPRPVIEKLSILLVDDSLSILKMTTMMLKRSGHKVEQADNGAEGLDTILKGYEKMSTLGVARGARQCPYDVVLMDLQMPVMDGFEAIRRLRAAEKQLKQVIEYDVNIGRSTDTESIYQTVSGESAGIVKDFAPLRTDYSRKMNSEPVDPEGANEVDSRKTVDSSVSGNNGARIASILLHGNNNKHLTHMLAPVTSPSGVSTPTNANVKSGRMRRQFVIGVSANSDHGTMMEAMKAGFDAFIGKPFSIDAFYEVLQSHQTKEREKNV